MLSQAVEDYVKTIYKLQESDDSGTATTNRLAEAMEVSSASATNMMKRLAEMHLVEHQSYKGVKLTPKGEKVALEIIRHHRLLELYLSEVMGYSWDQVHDEAEKLEHHISEQFEDTISAMLGHPSFDPHGDPIPTKDGKMPSTDSKPLTACNAGQRYIIRRISDQNPDVLRYLASLGLTPNVTVTLVEIAPFNGPVTLDSGHESLHIGYDLASRIEVIAA